jgi:hypothetical protein
VDNFTKYCINISFALYPMSSSVLRKETQMTCLFVTHAEPATDGPLSASTKGADEIDHGASLTVRHRRLERRRHASYVARAEARM